ncbi:MAG: SDR family oxidoreductase [Alphaproteobacteria bacterium]|nr:SDR family oxidoreductase [Alphaproteobacteria bacterium]
MAEATRILILGATSAIAERWARLRAARGDRLLLAARDPAKLAIVADDLRARGASEVLTAESDLGDADGAAERFSAFADRLGGVDIVLLAYGVLGDQADMQANTDHLRAMLDTNFTSAVIWSELAAGHLEQAGSGTLAVIASVAGDRGRRTNYAYGATKAGLSVYLEGLAHRFAGTPVSVLCVKPGFVDTPMTAHVAKGGPLWATPDMVAADIDRAIARRRTVIYTPWFWRLIMLIIRHLPRPIFNRLNI